MIRRVLSSLRFRLLLVVGLAVVPPLAVMLLTAAEFRRQETAETHARALQLVRHASAIHDRVTEGAGEMLFGLAQLSPMLRRDKARCREILSAYLQEHTDYDNLGVVRPKGEIFCAGRPPGNATSVGDHLYFRRAVATGQLAGGDYQAGRIAGMTTFTLGYPVLDKAGRLQAVVFAAMKLGWLNEITAEALLPDGTMLTVIDETGVIVAHYPDPEKWVGKSVSHHSHILGMLAHGGEGTAQGTFLDDVPRLFGFRPLRGPSEAGKLYACIGIPSAVAFARSNQIRAYTFTGLGLAAVLAMAAAWVGSDLFVLRGVKALLGATRRLRGGDLTARSGMLYGSGELSQLAFAFDEMAEALQRRHQENLRHSEKLAALERRTRALIENSSDGIVLLGADGTTLFASPSTTRITGYPVEDLIGRAAFEFIHPEDQEHVRARLGELVQRPKGVVSITSRVKHKDGSWRWIGTVASNLLDEPSVQAIICNYRDITERQEAEEALRQAHDELEVRVKERTAELATTLEALQGEVAGRIQAQADLRGLIDRVPIGLYRTTPSGQLLDANPALEQMLGYPSRQALVGTSALDLYVDPEDRKGWQRLLVRDGVVRNYEVQLRRRDGAIVWAHNSARAVCNEHGDVVAYEGAVEDVTERKRAEQALSESEARLAGIIDCALDAIVSIDADQRIILFNKEAERIFRCPAAEAVGQSLERFVPERFRDKHREGIRTFDTREGTDGRRGRKCTVTGLRATGEEFPIEGAISQTESGGQQIYTIVLRDITERQQAEEALRKLSGAIAETVDSVYITDRDGVIEYVNAAFEELTGFTREEAIGETPALFRSGLHDAGFYAQLRERILSGEMFRAVFVNKRRDGSLYHAEQTITPIRDSRGDISHFVCVGRDITERMRAEAELLSSRERLRALAARLETVREEERTRISREIHDELGQMLTVLKIDLVWLASRLPGESTALRERLKGMVSLTDGTIRAVRRISTELRPSVLDLGLVAAIEWQAQEFQARTGIECHFTSSEDNLDLDREASTAVFRICQETLTNVARHAGASEVKIALQADAGAILLVVQDDGRGITDAPGTKTRSLGILGMRERAQMLGGEISIVGVPGKGTTVKLIIPLKPPAKPTP